jgi:hypothetical protein
MVRPGLASQESLPQKESVFMTSLDPHTQADVSVVRTHAYEKFVTFTTPLLRVKPDDAHTPYSPMMRALCLRNQAAPITKNAYRGAVCVDGAISLQPDHDDR